MKPDWKRVEKFGSSQNFYHVGVMVGLSKEVKKHTENMQLVKDFVRKVEQSDEFIKFEDELPIQTGDAINFIELLENAIHELVEYTEDVDRDLVEKIPK